MSKLTRKSLRRLSSAASNVFSPNSSSPSRSPPLPTPVSSALKDHLFCSLQATKTQVVLRLVEEELLVLKVVAGKEGGEAKATRVLFTIPTLHILSVHHTPTSNLLHISYLTSSPSYTPTHLFLTLPSSSPTTPLPFVETLQKAAYPRTKPKRRVLLVVNPVGGKGKAVKLANMVVRPILEAAGCRVEVILTTYSGHGTDIARTLNVDAFDMIGTVSGDGMVHELHQGFATRPDALKCFRLPIVPVPAGSGNALSVSLHGKIEGFSIPLAALNLVKGIPLVLDLCSITQGDKPRLISFCSIALGIMADLDLGTENLRFLGDLRFVYGLLRNTIAMPSWQGSLAVKVQQPQPSKQELVEQVHSRLASTITPPLDIELDDGPLPEPRRNIDSDYEGWVRINSGDSVGEKGEEAAKQDDLLYVNAGLIPLAGRDLMQWPFSAPGEGLIDVVLQRQVPRVTLLKGFGLAETGVLVLEPSQVYLKATALQVTPSPNQQQHISIDGEAISSADGPFLVEVHKGLGRTMGLRGRWEGAEEFARKTGGGDEKEKVVTEK